MIAPSASTSAASAPLDREGCQETIGFPLQIICSPTFQEKTQVETRLFYLYALTFLTTQTSKTMTKLSSACVKLSVAFAMLTAGTTIAQQVARFPVISLNAGIHVIKAEVVAREAERQQGLMFREKMGPSEGMVFLFEAPADVCMWMKNTLIPLSVAFIDTNGKIVNIEDMQPQTTEPHCAKKLVRYALEMNQGWFKQKNIRPGTVIDGLPR